MRRLYYTLRYWRCMRLDGRRIRWSTARTLAECEG